MKNLENGVYRGIHGVRFLYKGIESSDDNCDSEAPTLKSEIDAIVESVLQMDSTNSLAERARRSVDELATKAEADVDQRAEMHFEALRQLSARLDLGELPPGTGISLKRNAREFDEKIQAAKKLADERFEDLEEDDDYGIDNADKHAYDSPDNLFNFDDDIADAVKDHPKSSTAEAYRKNNSKLQSLIKKREALQGQIEDLEEQKIDNGNLTPQQVKDYSKYKQELATLNGDIEDIHDIFRDAIEEDRDAAKKEADENLKGVYSKLMDKGQTKEKGRLEAKARLKAKAEEHLEDTNDLMEAFDDSISGLAVSKHVTASDMRENGRAIMTFIDRNGLMDVMGLEPGNLNERCENKKGLKCISKLQAEMNRDSGFQKYYEATHGKVAETLDPDGLVGKRTFPIVTAYLRYKYYNANSATA